MKTALLVILLLLSGSTLIAQHAEDQPDAAPPDQVAKGVEKEIHKEAHPTEEHGEGHAAPKTYFGIPGWILKPANMLLFIGFLFYLLRGPVKGAFQGRADRIRQELAEARKRREESDSMASDIQSRLNRLESEVGMILKNAAEEGERQKQELIAAANEEAQKILRSARSEVEARIKLARKELTDYAGELAAQRAHQLIADSLTESDRTKLFDESVKIIAEDRS